MFRNFSPLIVTTRVYEQAQPKAVPYCNCLRMPPFYKKILGVSQALDPTILLINVFLNMLELNRVCEMLQKI